MIDDQRVLSLVPARKNSKGIKNKNIIDLCGKPLIAYSIEAAKASRYVDAVIVSTDSKKIADISKEYGAEVPFKRPAELATDHATISSVAVHAINKLMEMGRSYDVIVILQPTQPLRRSEDIDGSLEKFISTGAQGVVTVSPVTDNPILIRHIDEQGRLIHLLNQKSTIRRQDMPLFYRVNGCVYIKKTTDMFIDTSLNDNLWPYIMDKSHSIDIDDMDDLAIAECFFKRGNNQT